MGKDQYAISSSACFYPEQDEPGRFDGDTITWTFELLKDCHPGPGLYRIEFVRNLTEAERAQKSATLLSTPCPASTTGAGSTAKEVCAAPQGDL